MGDRKVGDRSGDGARRAAKPLTARFVETVREPGKYHDANGLLLRVEPSGSKRWVQRIVVRGKRRELGLGSPSLVPLARARDLALANRRQAREGGDPLQARRAAAAILTFEEAARSVHETHKAAWRSAKHADQFIGSLEAHAFERLGARRVSDIDTADVLAVLEPIWLTVPETARRVRQRIGAVMKWAVAKGWRQDNPAQDIARALPKHDAAAKGQRKALPYGEVAGCIAAVRASRAAATTKLALEFLVLTATRSGEVRGALWEEFDLDPSDVATPATPATWTVPASRMKMKRPHRVPLSPRAVALLRAARKLEPERTDGLVFPGARGGPMSDMTMSKLVKELGFEADVHGFRTSFRTWAQEQTSFPREVAEAALAHTLKDKAEAAYARSDLFEKRRAMMEAWATYLGTSEPNDA